MILGKNKKIIFAILITVLLVVSFVIIALDNYRKPMMRGAAYNNDKYEMSGRIGMMYPSYSNGNDFMVPQDAAKSGEIAAIVNNLEDAKNKVEEIVSKNDAIIYSTNISYSSSDIKNAQLILQMPVDKFEAAFADLRGAGFKIVQEQSKQIPPIQIYPLNAVQDVQQNQAIQANDVQAAENTKEDTAVGSQDELGSIQASPVMYPQPQIQTQDKGYIRLVLADYGNASIGLNKGQNQGMMFFQSQSQDFSKVMWIVIGLKLAALAAMFGMLVYLTLRMIGSVKKHRAHKKSLQIKPATKRSVVHVIRKTPIKKTRKVKK